MEWKKQYGDKHNQGWLDGFFEEAGERFVKLNMQNSARKMSDVVEIEKYFESVDDDTLLKIRSTVQKVYRLCLNSDTRKDMLREIRKYFYDSVNFKRPCDMYVVKYGTMDEVMEDDEVVLMPCGGMMMLYEDTDGVVVAVRLKEVRKDRAYYMVKSWKQDIGNDADEDMVCFVADFLANTDESELTAVFSEKGKSVVFAKIMEKAFPGGSIITDLDDMFAYLKDGYVYSFKGVSAYDMNEHYETSDEEIAQAFSLESYKINDDIRRNIDINLGKLDKEPKSWRIIGKEEVLSFIFKFADLDGRYNESIRVQFMGGYCYYFANILKDRFGGGEICITAPYGHIVWVKDNIPYDIEGVSYHEYNHLIPITYLGEGKEELSPIDDFRHIRSRIYCTSKKETTEIIGVYKKDQEIKIMGKEEA